VTTRRWPLTLSAREGVATARAGRWTSLLIVVTLAWLCAAAGGADAVAITKLVDGEKRWIDAGAYVFVVTGEDRKTNLPTIPVGVCDRLSGYQGVLASFAARRNPQAANLGHIPGGRASLIDVSPGAARFLGSTAAAGDVALITTGMAKRTGMVDGEPVIVDLQGTSTLTGASSGVVTARVVDPTVMGAEYNGAILLPSLLTGQADACFVRTDATHVKAVRDALPTLLQHEGKLSIANPRLADSAFTINYATAYQDRPLRWAWVLTGALIGLLWSLVQWFRRSHVAIYTTFGMRAASRLVMQTSEWAVLAVASGLWGWALGTLGAVALGAGPHVAAAYVGAHVALTLVAASAVVVLLGLRPTGTLLNALKDR
jgi:hypothetical protein